jgi:hypothetical protein
MKRKAAELCLEGGRNRMRLLYTKEKEKKNKESKYKNNREQ